MEVAKIHIAVTIVATQLTALASGSIPYFPIEISRTAASSAAAYRVFFTGALSLFGTLYISGALNRTTIVVWLGLMMVAYFPDGALTPNSILNLVLHLSGVAVIFAASAVHVITSSRNAAMWTPLLSGVGIFLLRIFMKVGVLLVYDPVVKTAIPNRAWLLPFDSHLRNVVKDRAFRVMYQGVAGFSDDPKSQQILTTAVIPVFKVCGVLQWVALYALSLVL